MRASKHIATKGSIPDNMHPTTRYLDSKTLWAQKKQMDAARNRQARLVVVYVLPSILCALIAYTW